MIKEGSGKIILSVVLPVYNNGKHIYDNIISVSEILSEGSDNFEIIAVDDGSTDNTYDELTRLQSGLRQVRVLRNSINEGKGSAIKKGFQASGGDYIAFLDSDLDIDPRYLIDFLKFMKSDDVDAVIGSRFKKSRQRPLDRTIVSRCCQLLVRFLFGLPYIDTQAGIKLFKRDIIKVLPDSQIKRFAFDIELLVYLHRLNCRVVEYPIALNKFDKSTVKINDIFVSFLDALKLRLRLLWRRRLPHKKKGWQNEQQ